MTDADLLLLAEVAVEGVDYFCDRHTRRECASCKARAVLDLFEEVDGRILPTGSLVGGMASYDGFDGARKLYAIKGAEHGREQGDR